MENINIDLRQIRIIGKTGDRIVPISDQLYNLISKRDLINTGLKFYVFGYSGKVDERKMSVGFFLERFELLRKYVGLDNRYGPYSMKPTAVINMIKVGFKDRQIMDLTGHKTESAFAAYKRDLVIENDNVMKGSTVDF